MHLYVKKAFSLVDTMVKSTHEETRRDAAF